MALKKIVFFAVAAFAMVLAAGFALQGMPHTTGFSALHQEDSKEAEAENALLGLRKQCGIPLSAFEGLPLPPKDFSRMVSMMHSGTFTNYSFFSEGYFLQPEFYTSFPQAALPYWQNPDPRYYGAMGFGFFPAEQAIKVGKGSAAAARFFVHAGFGVETYQGVRIEASAPEDADFLKIEVREPEFLLGPTFPKFSENWGSAVDVKVSAAANAPAGEYRVVFSMAAPSAENSAEWAAGTGGKYFNAASAGAGISHTLLVVIG